ncbi:hypothetical protein SSPO_100050 [Streptomyces antimycoticus]|uniref:Uncharacterized protein n=1 Tax=Streptomyces antimycoticus TaxID=68175 RepID=A0A499VM62_9ACTN|nr:hypothetical protein [Streptomyces antimycoticus]BBJ47287.1 hypothetical protein SSPO_100050 [Streptomyces antimycoticus]
MRAHNSSSISHGLAAVFLVSTGSQGARAPLGWRRRPSRSKVVDLTSALQDSVRAANQAHGEEGDEGEGREMRPTS